MKEHEFIEKIDCNFPYDDHEGALRLIELGCSISPNTAYMVAYEIVSVPRSVTVSQARQKSLLAEWSTRFEHPLKDLVLVAAEHCIAKRTVPERDCLEQMEQVRRYPEQYNALAIVTSPCDDESGDVYRFGEEIYEEWRTAEQSSGHVPK